MTDARLPGRWLMDPTMRTLGADLWTVFSWALMWSAEQGTDGLIPQHMLPLLHPSGATTDHAEALVQAGLWKADGDGYRVRGWERTQSLAADVEHQRERNRRKQQAHRERSRVTGYVTGYVPGESPRTGQERLGEAEERSGKDLSDGPGTTRERARETPRRESPDERLRRLMATAEAMERTDASAISSSAEPATGWPVRAIPQ